MKTTLSYGMKLLIPVNPIEFVLCGITSSNSDKIPAEFIVEKYWPSDADANGYKVTCTPVDKSGRFGNEKFYSSDLSSMIESGVIKIINA